MKDFPEGLELEFFSPIEFDHPDWMDPAFLVDLDELRRQCGFPIRITDDARNEVEMARLYGPDRNTWPDSAHVYRPGRYLVRCVDMKPAAAVTFEERERKEIILVNRATAFYESGRWPCFGIIIETRHFHFDDYNWPGRRARRPLLSIGVSK